MGFINLFVILFWEGEGGGAFVSLFRVTYNIKYFVFVFVFVKKLKFSAPVVVIVYLETKLNGWEKKNYVSKGDQQHKLQI